MRYKDVIELLANNLSTYFAEVYHSAEIVTNDKGIKQPMVALGDEWISLVPTDQRETVYIRRNGDDEIEAELKMGSCVKSYKMRSSIRVVFFKDHAKNHNEILARLMQAVLVSGTKLKSITQNKWKLLKDESSGDYNFGATTAYFAVDVYALWHLQPDNCEEDFCIDIPNPLTCGPMALSTTPAEDCCPEFQVNNAVNNFQDVLNLIDSDTIEVEYLSNGTVRFNIINELELGPIGSAPNANAATLLENVLNLEPADVNFGGVVTASDAPQKFHGEKQIESATDTIFTAYGNDINKLRTVLLSNGSQAWVLQGAASVEAGTIAYAVPNGYPGIAFWDTSTPYAGRSQIRQYRHTGGISIGSYTPHGIPDNQLVVLPNGHTFLTGYLGNGIGETAVVERGYMLDVSGSAIIDGQVNMGTCLEFADNAAALLGGLAAGDIYRTVDALKIVH